MQDISIRNQEKSLLNQINKATGVKGLRCVAFFKLDVRIQLIMDLCLLLFTDDFVSKVPNKGENHHARAEGRDAGSGRAERLCQGGRHTSDRGKQSHEGFC